MKTNLLIRVAFSVLISLLASIMLATESLADCQALQTQAALTLEVIPEVQSQSRDILNESTWANAADAARISLKTSKILMESIDLVEGDACSCKNIRKDDIANLITLTHYLFDHIKQASEDIALLTIKNLTRNIQRTAITLKKISRRIIDSLASC